MREGWVGLDCRGPGGRGTKVLIFIIREGGGVGVGAVLRKVENAEGGG